MSNRPAADPSGKTMKRPSPSRSQRDARALRDAATALAIAALSFIGQDPERLGRFLALSGIGPESLRAAAREPGFLLGVLDHLGGDESLLLAFSGHQGIDPEEIAKARALLAGESRQAR
jgi:hypothetical protein